jgi:hypothetical protein
MSAFPSGTTGQATAVNTFMVTTITSTTTPLTALVLGTSTNLFQVNYVMPLANMTNATACAPTDYFIMATTAIFVKVATSSARCILNLTIDKAILDPLVGASATQTPQFTITFATNATTMNLYTAPVGTYTTTQPNLAAGL